MIKDFPRDKVKIASKWGPLWTAEGLSADMSMASCREQCEASLKRLGVDYLDLYIFRGPFKDKHGTTVEQCVENMKVSVCLCRGSARLSDAGMYRQAQLFLIREPPYSALQHAMLHLRGLPDMHACGDSIGERRTNSTACESGPGSIMCRARASNAARVAKLPGLARHAAP